MRGKNPIFPEIARQGDPWIVADGHHASTSFKERKIILPIDEDHRAYAAWHELLHTWATPQRSRMVYVNVDESCLQVVEDLRLEVMGRWRTKAPPMPKSVLNSQVNWRSLRHLTEALIAVRGCPEYGEFLNNARLSIQKLAATGENFITVQEVDLADRIANEACNRLFPHGPAHDSKFKQVVGVARWLTKLLRDLEDVKKDQEEKRTLLDYQVPDPSSPWGGMEIVNLAELNKKSVTTYMAHHRAREYGQNPSYPWRQILDGRPFRMTRMKARGLGGAILLDASGSMGDNAGPRSIMTMLKCAPASKIAAYAGYPTHSSSTRRGNGRLFILVDKGKMAPTEMTMNPESWGGENCVDFPALMWLARQPGPRYWVSDCQVTGKNYRFSSHLEDLCRQFCRVHDITIVGHPTDALKDMGVLQEKINRSMLEADNDYRASVVRAKERALASL